MLDERMKDTFDSIQITLFGLLAHNLFNCEFTQDPSTDWSEVIRESYYQGVHLIAVQRCNELELPDEARNEIRTLLRKYVMRNLLVNRQHTAIHRLMTENNIPYCILKGAASAYYYPDPFQRGMGDVDFFVHEQDLDRAEKLLLDNGFLVPEQVKDYHTVFVKDACKFEMHKELSGVPKDEMGDRVRACRETLTEDAVLTSNADTTFMRPSPFHHGLILLLHTHLHLFNEGIGLRHLCDWAVFVNTMTDEDFRRTFEKTLRWLGLWRFAQVLGLAAHIALGLPYRSWMGDDEADRDLACSLLLDFLEGGNFGVKDRNRNRIYESQLFRDDSKSQVGNAFHTVNEWLREAWPVTKKCPLLLPFGWVYYFCRRTVMVIKGEKKHIRISKTVKNSKKRQNIYRKIRLFHNDPD
jgi:hypothetical protein